MSGILGYAQEICAVSRLSNLGVSNYTITSGNDYAPLINPTHMYEVSDVLTWNKKKHSLSIGFDAGHYHFDLHELRAFSWQFTPSMPILAER